MAHQTEWSPSVFSLSGALYTSVTFKNKNGSGDSASYFQRAEARAALLCANQIRLNCILIRVPLAMLATQQRDCNTFILAQNVLS